MSGMKLSELDFVRLLPAFMRDDNAVIALSQAINRLMGDPDNRLSTIRTWDKIDELTEAECDELAWEFDVDWYDSVGMSLEEKRSTLKVAQQIKRKRGTKWAVERLISAYFGEGYVTEWYENEGAPFTFMVLTTNTHIVSENFDKFVTAVAAAKNERSHIAGIFYFWVQEPDGIECALGSSLHRYDFEPCGTRDRPATIGFAVRHSVETEPEEEAHLYELPKVGTVRVSLVGDAITSTSTYEACGTYPRPATLGTVQKTAAAVQLSMDRTLYSMTKCGVVRAAVVGTAIVGETTIATGNFKKCGVVRATIAGTAIVGKTTIATGNFIKCGARSAAIVGSAILGIAIVTSE